MLHQMKNILLLFLCSICIALNAQDSQDSKHAMVSYYFSISNSVVDQIDPYTPATTREKEQQSNFRKQLNRQLTDLFMDSLRHKLENSGKVALLPTNTFEGVMNYTDEGYPYALSPKKRIKKIGSKGLADYYYSFNIYVTPAVSLTPKLKAGGATKPEGSLNVKIFDGDGNVVKKISKRLKAKKNIKRIDFAGRKFNKLDLNYVDPLIDYLIPTLDHALTLAVADI